MLRYLKKDDQNNNNTINIFLSQKFFLFIFSHHGFHLIYILKDVGKGTSSQKGDQFPLGGPNGTMFNSKQHDYII